MKVTIEVPYAAQFDDYHDIPEHCEKLRTTGGKLISFECGFNDCYIAIFYVGRRPSNKKIKEIVKRDLKWSKEEMEEIRWTWEK